MDSGIAEHLRRVVLTCANWNDFASRVRKAYGESYLPHAEFIAREVQGRNWFNDVQIDPVAETEAPDEESSSAKLKGVNMNVTITQPPPAPELPYGSITLLTLKTTAALLVMAILFPPFYITLQDDMVLNLGFKFIGSTSSANNYVGSVNSFLLFCEILVICLVGMISFVLSRHWDKHRIV